MYKIIPCSAVDIDMLEKRNEIKDIIHFIHSEFESLYGVMWDEVLPLSVDDKLDRIKFRELYSLHNLVLPLQNKFKSQFNIIMNKVSITIKFQGKKILMIGCGEGTRNNKAGGGVKGKLFEVDLQTDIENYKHDIKMKYPETLDKLNIILKKEYDIDLQNDQYIINNEGGLNKKRHGEWSLETGMVFDPQDEIGDIVNDLTLSSNNKDIYMSLKFSSQFYLISASIRKYLHQDDINSNIEERNQIAKYFGFQPNKFYKPYDVVSYDNSTLHLDIIQRNWEKLLSGAIGYGYIYVVCGGSHDTVINLSKPQTIKVMKVHEPLYAIKGQRKYSQITLDVKIDNTEYTLACQFRGTVKKDKLPYYLRVLMKKDK